MSVYQPLLKKKHKEDDLDKIADITDNASDEELQKIADQIVNEQVTPEFTQLLYNALNDRHRDVITKRIAELTNVSFSEIEKERERNDEDQISPLAPGYNVQMPGGTGSPNVGISSYWSSSTCDSDPSDQDWVFFTNTPQTVSPSNMRWYATSSLVTWAFNFAYGGQLSTYGSTLYQINICLGTNGVTLAGGASSVKNNLRVKYR